MTVYWACVLNNIITVWLIRRLIFLYFVAESLKLTRIQLHHLCIGHVTLTKYKYLRLYDTEKENDRNSHFAKFIAMCLLSFTYIL